LLPHQTIAVDVEAVEAVEAAIGEEGVEVAEVVWTAQAVEDEGMVVMRTAAERSDEGLVEQRDGEAEDAATHLGPAEYLTLLRSTSRAMQPSTWPRSNPPVLVRQLLLPLQRSPACAEIRRLGPLVHRHPCRSGLWVKRPRVQHRAVIARVNRSKADLLRCR